jgi:hypothetical protein
MAATVFFGSGCSKGSSSAQAVIVQTNDFGPLDLVYGQGLHRDIGNGRDCVITAQPMDRDSIELLVSIEKAGKKIASTRVLPARIGAPLDLSLGQVQIQFRPQIKP